MKVRQHNSTLSVDTDKARDWVQRSRKPLGRGKRKRRLVVPPETRMRARARSDGRCVVCVFYGHQGRGSGKAEHLHHVLSVERYPLLELVEENMVGCCHHHHLAYHGSPNFKIPLLALPECVFRLAADVGPAAVDYLLSRYEDGSRLAREAG